MRLACSKEANRAYSHMYKALPPLNANATHLADPDDDDGTRLYLPEDDNNMFANLPPNSTHV